MPRKKAKSRSPISVDLPASDPYAAREAKNYENPIPSREYLLEVITNHQGPVTHEQMCELLNITDPDGIEGVRRRLIAMSRDGQLISNRRGAFGAINKMDLVRGRVQGHKEGFGFVIDTEGGEDIYLSNRQMRQVFDGDEVVVRSNTRDHRGRKEGSIVEVLARNTKQLVGRVFSESGINFVRPDNSRLCHDVMVTKEKLKGAKRGQYVVVGIVQQPDRNNLPTGEVIEILGEHMAPGMEIDVAIRSHDIPCQWPSDVLAEAETLPDQVDDLDKRKRVDLRKLPFVTIDGEDARDFDDAVYAERKKGGGWRLFVAIADVSHYVMPESALDREAINRGNSVYFPDYVVPMLPEALSNGLCSLNPQVDRLVMVCEMTVSAAGKVSGYKFYEGVIHSHERLTYTKVGQMIAERADERSGIRKQYHHVLPAIDTLHELYLMFRRERDLRGAIDFETVETRILFDAERKIERIVPVHRNDAHKLIEECMLAANVCAARLLEKAEIEALYRVHEGPSGEKLENLRAYLGELGLSMRGKGGPKPGDYQKILELVQDRPDAHIIQMVMLRSMSQAKYQPDNNGHFGLAYSAYAHFTSPIRRYPDLLVHRAIRFLLRSGVEGEELRERVSRQLAPVKSAPKLKRKQIYPYDMAAILQLGEQCSLTERRADDATREVVSWLKCEYLSDRVGEVFEGVVSAVTNFGLFVELKDLYVEGLVHVTALPGDYYHYEQAHHRLVGERTRVVYRLGDELTVSVVNVNLDDRKIDFELVAAKPSKVKVSAKAKLMAQMHAEDQARKAGSKGKKTKHTATAAATPRKRPAQVASKASSRELKQNLMKEAARAERAPAKAGKQTAAKAAKKSPTRASAKAASKPASNTSKKKR
ncbi:ribonuclease R [Halioxenophilus sp. WMMB6]|uniref:ribonuclease R n=1 Tax=Halioxenophilus sp. WMMB6 TaxID=3073815 RepID=UPI00295E9521|nr:ribonuclease R [Halioxenophilus sp. WMMB6]